MLQGAAVEAAARLDEALAQPRCSSAALKTALTKAEAAAAAAAPGQCQFAVGAELLLPRIQVRGRSFQVGCLQNLGLTHRLQLVEQRLGIGKADIHMGGCLPADPHLFLLPLLLNFVCSR